MMRQRQNLLKLQVLQISRQDRPYYSNIMPKMFSTLVSSQCARGKSFIARKPEVYPKFLSGKKTFKNVTLQILNFILVS